MSALSVAHRDRALDALDSHPYDALIVGGGITGAAVARLAAQSGLRVALCERGDFASGTSSRSSRLIHGGFRYLQQGQVGMVRRCLAERERIAAESGGIVRRVPFLMPLYRTSPHPAWALKAGIRLYRALCVGTPGASGRCLKRSETLAAEPGIADEGLVGGVLYHECLTHDARLTLEAVLDAADAGAHVLNYAVIEGYAKRDGRIVGAVVRDGLSSREADVRASIVVDATGPWARRTDDAVQLSKGVHIVMSRRRLPLNHTVVFFSPEDRRGLFAIPQENFVLVGTTDTPYSGSPGDASPDAEDIAYLLSGLAAAFPNASLTESDVADSWAGVRAMADGREGPTSAMSRDYRIECPEPGLLAIRGGKMTLHRRIAEDAVSAIISRLGMNSALEPSPRAQSVDGVLPTRLARAGVSAALSQKVVERYGRRASRFLHLLAENPGWAEPILPSLPYIWAEVPYAIRYEMAVYAEDFLRRRTDLAVQARAENLKVPIDFYSLWDRESRREVCGP